MNIVFEDIKIKGCTYLSAKRGHDFYLATKRYDSTIHILLLQATKFCVTEDSLIVTVTPDIEITFNKVGSKL